MARATLLQLFDEAPGAPRRAAIALRLATERITLADLIRRRVAAEVASFNAGASEVFAGLVQPSDSERQLNGYKLRRRRTLDADAQAEAALQAFARNGFIVLFEDRQVERLDQQLVLTGDSAVTFIRLLPLVGG